MTTSSETVRQDDRAGAREWALTLTQYLIHVGVIVTIVVAPVAVVVYASINHQSWQIGLATLLALPRLVRAAVRVRVDPAAGTLTFARALGGSLDTRLDRVRRIDHGGRRRRFTGRSTGRRFLRVATDDGTITLSPWFGVHRDEIGDDLARRCPHAVDARPVRRDRDGFLR
jgi:hypothetical protein